MARKSSYTRNKRRDRQTLQAIDAMLRAGAEEVLQEVEDEFDRRDGGFKDGLYATDRAARSNIVGQPFTKNGRRRVRVVNLANRDGRPYPVFWELGHENLFSGDYEHHPLFEPAMLRAAPRVAPAMARVIKRGLWKQLPDGTMTQTPDVLSGEVSI